MQPHRPEFLKTRFIASPALHPDGRLERIAYLDTPGDSPTILWCGGLMSDMRGTKASVLHQWASDAGHAFIRFDYLGHGESSGEFTQGSISRWAADTLQIIDELTTGPLILIGSSMGGWTSLLAARARPDRVKALLLINPAPDFTEWMWDSWTEAQRETIQREGILFIPSDYGDPYPYTLNLIEDGRTQRLLDKALNLDIPVHIFSGADDDVVPTARCEALQRALPNAKLTVIEGGDHSLSRPEDMARLQAALSKLISACATPESFP